MKAIFKRKKRPERSDYEIKNAKKVHNLFKIVLVGETNVGKTSLVQRFSRDTFNERTTSTVHAEYTVSHLVRKGQPVRVQLWDITGQDCMRAIVPNFFRYADAILLVYDVTNVKSFEKLEDWFDTVNKHSEPDTRLYVIGTKCDLKQKKVVPIAKVEVYLQGREMHDSFPTSLRPFETSAADGQGVYESFEHIIEDLLTSNQQDPNTTVPSEEVCARDRLNVDEPSTPPRPLWRRLCC